MTALLAIAAAISVLPDPHISPGVVNPHVTKEMLDSPAYIKASRYVSLAEKKEVFQRYNIPWSKHSSYEVDHVIPLCLGGENSISNLWPQKWGGTWGAHAKDRAEVRLHRLVKSGKMPLSEAQQMIGENWTNAFIKVGLKSSGLRTTVFKLTHTAVK